MNRFKQYSLPSLAMLAMFLLFGHTHAQDEARTRGGGPGRCPLGYIGEDCGQCDIRIAKEVSIQGSDRQVSCVVCSGHGSVTQAGGNSTGNRNNEDNNRGNNRGNSNRYNENNVIQCTCDEVWIGPVCDVSTVSRWYATSEFSGTEYMDVAPTGSRPPPMDLVVSIPVSPEGQTQVINSVEVPLTTDDGVEATGQFINHVWEFSDFKGVSDRDLLEIVFPISLIPEGALQYGTGRNNLFKIKFYTKVGTRFKSMGTENYLPPDGIISAGGVDRSQTEIIRVEIQYIGKDGVEVQFIIPNGVYMREKESR
jgi:hypothetical protein